MTETDDWIDRALSLGWDGGQIVDLAVERHGGRILSITAEPALIATEHGARIHSRIDPATRQRQAMPSRFKSPRLNEQIGIANREIRLSSP